MNFDLSEEQIQIRDAARDFAENEIAPSTVQRDIKAVLMRLLKRWVNLVLWE